MRWLDRLRGIRDVRDECGTWRAGMLAVCVADTWVNGCLHSPRIGDVLRVTQVDEEVGSGLRARFLRFAGKPANHAWISRAFRPAVADDQPATAEFRATLQDEQHRPAAPARQLGPVQ